VFGWLASLGVEEEEMRRVFNLGVGYIAVVPADVAELAVRVLTGAGETAWVAGELVEGDGVVLH
jgi:phosphoribosylformylglycinamidine cyclo-ligase